MTKVSVDIKKITQEVLSSISVEETDQSIIFRNLCMGVYRLYVSDFFPNDVDHWPVISGADATVCNIKGYGILVFKHTGMLNISKINTLGNIPLRLLDGSIEDIRRAVEIKFGVGNSDAVFIFPTQEHILSDVFQKMLKQAIETNFIRHKMIMNKEPVKIFLSHKSEDKDKVRKYKRILQLLGFDPWLDEEALNAGDGLERSLLKGLQDSCAAIFFITKNYKDEKYLESEINYAIQQTRQNPNFRVITLVFDQEGEKNLEIPPLLSPYVYKNIINDLDGVYEILRALPLEVGPVSFKVKK